MSALQLDPYDHQFHWDPYPTYKALREQDPVHYNADLDLWFLTKWDDVFGAFRDFKSFINTGATSLEKGSTEALPYPMFIFSDPPEHTRVRNLFMPLMTPSAVASLEGYIREKTLRLLQPKLKTGKFDFVDDLGCFLPMDVISNLTSVPAQDQDKVRGWADDLIAREDKQHALSERNINGFINMATYFETHSAMFAASGKAEGLVDIMLRAEQAGTMNRKQTVGTLILLAIAGNETTTKLIGNMAYRLWQHKDQRALLAKDLSLVVNAVEETLRYDGSSQIIVRRAGKDVTLRGKTIPEGARIGLCIISANRDADKYKDPDRYDVTRGARDHMAFGMGIHACLGSALARLEARVVFEEILRLIPDYEIDESGLRRAHNPNVRGFTHVPASFAVR